MTTDSATEVTRRSMGATLGVFLSRLSGIFRTQVVNAVFGASSGLDGFYAANRFPNALRDLFADGALSSAFTKVYVDEEKKGLEDSQRLIATTITVFGATTLTLAVLGMIYAQEFLGLVTGDQFADAGALDVAVISFRWLAFYLPLTMLSSVCMSVLSVTGQTLLATFASAFFNVGMIIGALFLTKITDFLAIPAPVALAWGVLIGGIAQFGFMAVPLARKGLLISPLRARISLRGYRPIGEIMRLMAPRALVQGASQIALMINTFYASQCGPGALTYITNATLIVLVPVGLFGVASGFASLPLLSQSWINKETGKFREILSTSLSGTLWMSASSAAAFALCAMPLCVALFRHGRYTTADCLWTSLAIAAYMGGMVFNAGSKVVAQGFFALNNTWLSMFNAVTYLIVNATLSSILAPRYGIIGLGISNSSAAMIDFTLNLILLRWIWRKSAPPGDKPPLSWKAVWPAYIITPSLMGLGLALQPQWNDLLTSDPAWPGPRLMQNNLLFLVACALIGGLLWTALTMSFGPLPLRGLVSRLLRRLGFSKNTRP